MQHTSAKTTAELPALSLSRTTAARSITARTNRFVAARSVGLPTAAPARPPFPLPCARSSKALAAHLHPLFQLYHQPPPSISSSGLTALPPTTYCRTANHLRPCVPLDLSTDSIAPTMQCRTLPPPGPPIFEPASFWSWRWQHTFFEGGVRVMSFVAGPLIPPSRRGTRWAGMAVKYDFDIISTFFSFLFSAARFHQRRCCSAGSRGLHPAY